MTEELPAMERVSILRQRIANLNKGSGDYDLDGRIQAINAARSALDRAERELANGR